MEVKELEERIEKDKFNFRLFVIAFAIIGLVGLNFPVHLSIRLIIHIVPLFATIYFMSNFTFSIFNKVIVSIITFAFLDILVTIFILLVFFNSDNFSFLYLLQKMYFLN